MTFTQILQTYASLPQDLKRAFEEYLVFLQGRGNEPSKPKKRQAGLAQGLIAMKDNFDDPIEDFEAYR